MDHYTIKWTNPETGQTNYPITPIKLTKEEAQVWVKHGEVDEWKGEIVEWSQYEIESKQEVK